MPFAEDGEKEQSRQAGTNAAGAPPSTKKRSALAASFGKAVQKQPKGKGGVSVKNEPLEKPVEVPPQTGQGKVQSVPSKSSKPEKATAV